ncbi:hypothetical protein BOTBODRAFT_61695 [Botryobasidium botryosum FD-172 SS1]|uniref:Major facilitator superfamily (MFS) profile domain-containing protein n=1 Tax=Botryobasidium botryosum (strain FD-172 SS1) TaxID=930990 RepID=A0A067N0V3_BOTB1|nr:hypothetical protein BOTBODRAFT_61695 [Botryobasidium botryosum FD-172 SS1]
MKHSAKDVDGGSGQTDGKGELVDAYPASESTSIEIKNSHGDILRPTPSADPKDPLNWGPWKKRLVLFFVCSFYFLFTFITTVTVPTFFQLQSMYNTTYAEITYTVAVPALALAVSPLLWSPLADIYGRRPIMITGCLLALVATIGTAVAKNISAYMACRFLQGWGVGPASTVGLVMLHDIYFEHERGEKMGYWTLSIDSGLLFGPLIGGFVALVSTRFVAWFTAILFGALLIALVLLLPETAFARDLAPQRTSKTGEIPPTSPSSWKTIRSGPWFNYKPIFGIQHPHIWDTTVRAFKLFAYPNVALSIIFYCWTWYWFILCVIAMIPAAYPNDSPQTQGLLFLGLIIGTLIAEAFFSGSLSDRLVRYLSRKRARSGEDPADANVGAHSMRSPEMRLWLYWPAAIFTAVGLVVFGCSVQLSWHWIIGQVGMALFAFGIQIGNTITTVYAVDCYPQYAMDVTVFYSLHLNLSAFASPFFIVPWVERNGWAWAFGAQALIVVGCAIVCVLILQLWGRQMREWKGPISWSPGVSRS